MQQKRKIPKRKLPIPENKIDPIYDSWNKVKKKLARKTKLPYFKEGQVFWCSVGQNIGSEIYGKGPNFARPVLVCKKLSKTKFMGVPFSTKIHKGHPWYLPLNFAGKKQAIVLSQINIYDVARLHQLIGEFPESDFIEIQAVLAEFYFGKR